MSNETTPPDTRLVQNLSTLVAGVAKVCHEVNKAYCESLGDLSQPTWEFAPDNIKQSAYDGVLFHLENPDAPPSASHENWLKFKKEDGWKFGPIKDAVKKEHPCFCPYDELPQEQRTKDFLFKQVVSSLLP